MTEQTQTYRVNGGHRSYETDEYLEDGEAFEPTQRELENHPTKFEIVAGNAVTQTTEDSPDDGGSDEADGTDAERAAEFVDNNAEGVATAIADGEADGHLAEVREAEGERSRYPNRNDVHDALDERSEETGEDAGERPDGE